MVRLTRIYTRTGDDGSTGLVDGSRDAKDSARIAAIGDVDEANSSIGLAIALLEQGSAHGEALRRIQNDLFDLGADVATPGEDFTPSTTVLRVVDAQVAWLESEMDRMNEALPPLSSFILPGGSPAAAALHVARATTRRAERTLVAAAREAPVNPAALRYLNRLSDYLFVLCRVLNQASASEVVWVPGASR